jgi:hypothetical protein
MEERPSTCEPRLERETLLVYVYLLRALNFVGGWQGRNMLSKNGGDGSRDQALLRWPPCSPDLTPCYVLSIASFYSLYYGSYLRCEDESLPFQKSIVTCCSGQGRQWIIGLTSAVSQRADTYSTYEVCKKEAGRFSVHRQVACYNALRHSIVPIL